MLEDSETDTTAETTAVRTPPKNEVDYFLELFGFNHDSQLANVLDVGQSTVQHQWRNNGIPRNNKMLLKLLNEEMQRKKHSQATEARKYLEECKKVLWATQSGLKNPAPTFHEVLEFANKHVITHKDRLKLTNEQKTLRVAEGLARGAHAMNQLFMSAQAGYMWPPQEIY